MTRTFHFTIKILFLVGMLLSWQAVEAATLSLSPGTGVYTAGGTFTARVVVNTAGESINAAEGTLRFDTSNLSVVGLTKGSIFSLWAVDPTYSNSAGTISFGGGSPSGYSGGAGTVLSVTFRAKTAGTGKVTFSNGSVLAADGRGTNVLTSMNSGSYTIAAAEVPAEPEVIEYVAPPDTPGAATITSTTHPNSDGWFLSKTAELAWTVPSDVTAVRTLLSDSAGSIPTKVYEPPISSLTINDLKEGVQYFHLQLRNADGWGRVAHYRLAVDTTDPIFDLELPEAADLSSPTQTFNFNASDTPSGIAKYTVQIDGGEVEDFKPQSATSSYVTPALLPGQHSMVVEAFDQAGNSVVGTITFTILAFDRPEFTEYPVRLNAGVIPVIKGVTRPQSVVTVSLAKQDGSVAQEYEVTADAAGVFTFIPDGALTNGVYELTATAIDTYGAQSERSEPVRIAVEKPGYLTIGTWAVSVLSVLIPLLALVGLLLFGVLYVWRRSKTVGVVVQKETAEALRVVEKQFINLHKVLEKEAKNVAASRRTKKLTKAETSLIESVRMGLADAEKTIKKEVADVDDIIEK